MEKWWLHSVSIKNYYCIEELRLVLTLGLPITAQSRNSESLGFGSSHIRLKRYELTNKT